jgi:hypothetical protein
MVYALILKFFLNGAHRQLAQGAVIASVPFAGPKFFY